MNRIKLVPVLPAKLQRIRLVELEGVSFLRFDIHAHNLKPGSVISHGRPASATKKIEQPWFQCVSPHALHSSSISLFPAFTNSFHKTGKMNCNPSHAIKIQWYQRIRDLQIGVIVSNTDI
jgi:hypothetical protein